MKDRFENIGKLASDTADQLRGMDALIPPMPCDFFIKRAPEDYDAQAQLAMQQERIDSKYPPITPKEETYDLPPIIREPLFSNAFWDCLIAVCVGSGFYCMGYAIALSGK